MGESTAEGSLEMSSVQLNKSSEDLTAKQENIPHKTDDTYQEQSSTRIIPLLVSVFLTMFLVALDRTIISTVCFPSSIHLLIESSVSLLNIEIYG